MFLKYFYILREDIFSSNEQLVRGRIRIRQVKNHRIRILTTGSVGYTLSEKDLTITRQTQKSSIGSAIIRLLYSTWGLLVDNNNQSIIFRFVFEYLTI